MPLTDWDRAGSAAAWCVAVRRDLFDPHGRPRNATNAILNATGAVEALARSLAWREACGGADAAARGEVKAAVVALCHAAMTWRSASGYQDLVHLAHRVSWLVRSPCPEGLQVPLRRTPPKIRV